MFPTTQISRENEGVYELITSLCEKTASKYCNHVSSSQKQVAAKMRSRAYEIILKQSGGNGDVRNVSPFIDLLSYSFGLQNSVQNVMEFKKSSELKDLIHIMKETDFGENKDHVNNVLKLLIGLCDTDKQDTSNELHQHPFTFGILDEMLPKPKQNGFGSCQPYSYFPSHIFKLPFSLKSQGFMMDKQGSHSYTDYTVDTFESRSSFTNKSQFTDGRSFFLSPVSFKSISSHKSSHIYTDNIMLDCPRLTAPRDLQIPISSCLDSNVKLSVASTDDQINSDVQEVFRDELIDSVDVWEMVTKLDDNIPEDIWDYVSKLPPSNDRQIIAGSAREMALWRHVYQGQLTDLNIISEKLFIRHIMYLIIGIETSSFPFGEDSNYFYMAENLALEGISREYLKGYVSPLLVVGTYYKRLFNFAFNITLEDNLQSKGLIYEAAREAIRKYLLKFRLTATEIFEDIYVEGNCMPTLLGILHHIEPLRFEIETVVTIYKLSGIDSSSSLPRGAELMSYLFNEISVVTHRQTSLVLYNSLFTVCKVYFKFIERFIFEGELDDPYNEFFIRKDNLHVNSRSKRYWDKGFHIVANSAVPEFLRPLASFILLCGKSLRLLKLCIAGEPLVALLSAAHPAVRCCSDWAQLASVRRLLDVYRTRCLFVAGEPASLQRLLLQRDAEKKAFAEMASLKQAETMEKIVAERKRLSQLIIAEKQHSLKVLEAAMAETKAAKNKAKLREKKLHELEVAAERATEEVDSKLKEDESHKIMEYYSKLNFEVEKSKIHTEWKIKRLQLDESRMQLLSTEERNLKREKLELEHQRNEDVMAMSIQSIDCKSEDELEIKNVVLDEEKLETKSTVLDEKELENKNTELDEVDDKYKLSSEIDNAQYLEKVSSDVTEETSTQSAVRNRNKAQLSSDVFSAICNVAISIFGGRKQKADDACDNEVKIDSEGNIVDVDLECNLEANKVSNDLKIQNTTNHLEYLERKLAAMHTKQKVMTQVMGSTDHENNDLTLNVPAINSLSVDEDNNVDDTGPFAEAKRNKLRSECSEGNLEIIPRTILYNLESKTRSDSCLFAKEPGQVAHEEALLNKKKVLGVEFNLPLERSVSKASTVAQNEAIRNKQKVLGLEYNLNENKSKESSAYRVTGSDISVHHAKEPANVAQEEAIRNKMKVLGVEYNISIPTPARESANSQEDAISNKTLILESKYDCDTENSIARCDSSKRSKLRLNLKPCNETLNTNSCITPNTGTTMSGELIPGSVQLDLETPTTAEMPLDGMTCDILSPKSEKYFESDSKPHKEYLTSDGFNFSLIDEETVDAMEATPDTTPAKTPPRSTVNILDGSYNLDNFDPFGVKQHKSYSRDFFARSDSPVYTDPAVIMANVMKRPYNNIFASRFDPDSEEEEVVTCDNIVTLTTCLQRSVMLPLTYQLEVVNNSILTYFLINLDMYEHLKSMRDYFFLMDGEFSRSICHNLFSKLTKTLNPQELLNFATLHNILDKALGSSILHSQKFSSNLSFCITECPLSFQHSSADVLQCLSLSYSIRWPLNIILSPEALQRYARVFQFLLKMRRISWVLGEDFENLKVFAKSSKHSRQLLRSSHYISIQLYRHVMASLIRALDTYIVTTCILTSWTEFESELKKALTLDDLYECHVIYVKKVLFRCLLNNRSTPVMKLLNDMFTVILKFSRLLKAGEWQQKSTGYVHPNFAQLEELFHLFTKLARYLHKVVARLTECGYQRHLVELLTLVNLNGYYDPERSREENNSTQNTSMQST